MPKPRILFILKRREDFNPVEHSPLGLSTGLFNSASFMVEMLKESKIEADIKVAIDNNCIDRMVRNYNPTHVIIEALWVVPSKFAVLCKLHPNVRWIIRLHSEMPFMAGEGMAMDWLGDYVSYDNIDIGINAPRMLNEVRTFIGTAKGWDKTITENRIFYLPNYYPQDYKTKEFNYNKEFIDIACFGAIRPLKNHMVQAVAALKFANKLDKKLHFHINAGRVEMQGSPVLNNLKGFFQHLHNQGHQMILHEWCPREEFLQLCSYMDIGMQCNFSETFNIVSADLISQGVPVLGCSEIPWASNWFNADPTNSDDICSKLALVHAYPKENIWLNQRGLQKYTTKTRKIWLNQFEDALE